MAVKYREKSDGATAPGAKARTLPNQLDEMMRGFMPSRCILTALELDLFTAVGDGATAEEVGARIEANVRGVSILLNALVALGLLDKSGEEYKNTAKSARFNVRGSKESELNGLLHIADIWHRWSTLTDAVRSGTRVAIDSDLAQDWTRHFIAGMQRNASPRAPLVVKALGTEGVRSVLDLGGGSGIYSIAFARACADVKCEILDLAEVVPLTAEYIGTAGVSAQVTVRSGDMLHGDLGSGYDVVMLNAICHMFSEEQNRDIFLRARHALAPNGRLVVQDFILDPDKTGPLQAALFSVNMLVGTDAGASYNEQEYTAWMKDAGFNEVRRIDLPGPSDLIVGQVR